MISTAARLWPYIWPKDRTDLKLRVLFAVVLMVAAKLTTIAVPYAFKWATDALAGERALDKIPLPSLLSGIVALTIVYGGLRALMSLFTQGRDAPSR